MPAPHQATVVVVPRESFDLLPSVLRRLHEVTPPIFDTLVLEGRAPEAVRSQVPALQHEQPHLRVVWSEHWLRPHEAVNQALALVATEYVVFLDNDVEVAPGWLEALLACAREEGAGCVHPIHLGCSLAHPRPRIHVAEGRIVRERRGDRWTPETRMTAAGRPLHRYRPAAEAE